MFPRVDTIATATATAAFAEDPRSLAVARPRLVGAAAAAAAFCPAGDQPALPDAGGRGGSSAERGGGVRARSFRVEPGGMTGWDDGMGWDGGTEREVWLVAIYAYFYIHVRGSMYVFYFSFFSRISQSKHREARDTRV